MLRCKLRSVFIKVYLRYLTNLFADETDDLSRRVHEATKVFPGFGGLLCLSAELNDELQRVQGKLRRTLERLRRACIKVLDGEAKVQNHVIISLLMVISAALEDAFKQVSFHLTHARRN